MGDGLSSGSPPNTTDIPIATLDQEDSDDAWMNRFGKDSGLPSDVKEPLTETSPSALETKRSSLSVTDTKASASNISIDPFNYPTRKKKNPSLSRIETTSYSFSLGNSLRDEEESSESINDSELSGWVKRDSKERVPVRKHLKSVNIKAAVNVPSPPLQPDSPGTSSFGLKDTPFTLLESKAKSTPDTTSCNKNSDIGDDNSFFPIDSEKDDSFALEPQRDGVSEVTNDSQLSPSKRAPAVLPKPKKHLDKKSWTADLIKSKSQTMADQPQPGSLNDKLLSINRRKTEEKATEPGIPRTSPSNKSIKEIRTNFAISSRNTTELDRESNQELSKSFESGCINEQDEKGV